MSLIILALVLFFLVGPLVGNYIIRNLVLETLTSLKVHRLTEIGKKREMTLVALLSVLYGLIFIFFVSATLSLMFDKVWMFGLLVLPLAIRTSINNIVTEDMGMLQHEN